jgi:hypothetical protein
VKQSGPFAWLDPIDFRENNPGERRAVQLTLFAVVDHRPDQGLSLLLLGRLPYRFVPAAVLQVLGPRSDHVATSPLCPFSGRVCMASSQAAADPRLPPGLARAPVRALRGYRTPADIFVVVGAAAAVTTTSHRCCRRRGRGGCGACADGPTGAEPV